MGIKVWQQRGTENSSAVIVSSDTNPIDENNTQTNHSQVAPIAIDSTLLSQSTLFTDILQCIDISIGEVVIDNNQINLGLLNWRFIETDSITFSKNTLTTPVITAFENSTKLKKALWQIIQQEVLA